MGAGLTRRSRAVCLGLSHQGRGLGRRRQRRQLFWLSSGNWQSSNQDPIDLSRGPDQPGHTGSGRRLQSRVARRGHPQRACQDLSQSPRTGLQGQRPDRAGRSAGAGHARRAGSDRRTGGGAKPSGFQGLPAQNDQRKYQGPAVAHAGQLSGGHRRSDLPGPGTRVDRKPILQFLEERGIDAKSIS